MLEKRASGLRQILVGLELGVTPESWGSPLQKLRSHRLVLSRRDKARSRRTSRWAAAWTLAM